MPQVCPTLLKQINTEHILNFVARALPYVFCDLLFVFSQLIMINIYSADISAIKVSMQTQMFTYLAKS